MNLLLYKMGFREDIVVTLLNGIGVSIGVLILYGLIARSMGMDALGEFLLVRRTALTLMGVFFLGMTTALPYYVAKGGDNAYGAAALLLFVLLTVPLVGLTTGVFHFGLVSGFPRELALPFFVFTVGYALLQLTYNLLRGHLNMLGANLLQLVCVGLIPVGIFFLVHDRFVPSFLTAIGVGSLTLAGLVYFLRMGRAAFIFYHRKILQLLSYGVQRIPSSLAYFILLGGVPLLILSDTSKAEIAYVNSGISFVRLFLFFTGPLGMVLLPRIAKALAAGQKARVARGIEVLGKAVLLIAMPLTLFLSMNSAVILDTWLGSESMAGVKVMQLIILALPFYLLMTVLRSPVDAGSARGYVSIIYGAAALALLLVFYALKFAGMASVQAGVISFIAGHLVGSVGSLYYIHKLYGINILGPWYLLTVAGLIAFSLVATYCISALVSGLMAFLLGGVTLTALLGLFFLKSRSDWIVDLRSMVLIR